MADTVAMRCGTYIAIIFMLLAGQAEAKSCRRYFADVNQTGVNHSIKIQVERINLYQNKLGMFREKTYRIHAKRNPEILELKYEGTKSQDGVAYEMFSRVRNGKREEVLLKPEDIHGWAEYFPEREGGLANFSHKSKQAASLLREVMELVARPYTAFADRAGIKVVGTSARMKPRAMEVAEKLEAFDRRLSALGFSHPEATRIILQDKAIFEAGGPAAIQAPIHNIWDRSSRQVLAIRPIKGNANVVHSDSILLHERTHHFLRRTYGEEAFVNRSESVQEALADFVAAHETGNPKIGMGAGLQSQAPQRDIETMAHAFDDTGKPLVAASGNAVGLMDSVAKLTATFDHQNSLLFSNVLWELRKAVGKDAIDAFLKPFMDGLNKYHESYAAILRKSGIAEAKGAQAVVYEFEYFLAVMLKSARESGMGPAAEASVRRTIESRFHDFSRVDAIAKQLAPGAVDFGYKGPPSLKVELVTASVVATAIVGTVVLGGYTLYQYGKSLLPEPRK